MSVYNAGDSGSIPGSGDTLEKEMAIRSSTIVWKIPWTEEPGRIQFMRSQRVGHDLVTKQQQSGIGKVLSLLLTSKDVQGSLEQLF